MPNQTHNDDTVTDCERCNGTGWVEYEVDYFGRKTEWGSCGECVDGEVTREAA